MWGWLKGKKSYLLSAAGVVVAGLAAKGIISQGVAEFIGAVLASGLGMTLRSAIANK